ncbi:MAG: pyridoxamine 5-phosphate oxidase [Treponema sp.]|nr:pyridoxamine 5-phosphate oxidase [Treponema sp.]
MNRKTNFGRLIGYVFFFGFFIIGCAKKPDISSEKDFEKKELSELIHILEGYRNGVLANRDGEKLRTQIMTFSFAEGNRAYFCTTVDKPLYAQLAAFPYVSYCTFPEDWEPVLSLNGKVVFVEDRALKERALESNYYAKMNFKDIDNPLLRVFYIDVEEIETYGSGGVNIYTAK